MKICCKSAFTRDSYELCVLAVSLVAMRRRLGPLDVKMHVVDASFTMPSSEFNPIVAREALPTARRVVVYLLLGVWLASLIHAQSLQVPDSVNLTDPRFFKDPQTGELFAHALALPGEETSLRLQEFMAAYDHARRHGDLGGEAICSTELALQYLGLGEAGRAFDWVNHALSLDSLIAPLSPLRQRMHRNIAGIYTDFDAHKLALYHNKIALQIDEQRSPVATPRRYRHCSNLAICFQKSGQLDSALIYYHRCIGIASTLQERVWHASALNNLGMVIMGTGKLDSALHIFQTAYDVLRPDNDERLAFAVSVKDNIGEAMLKLGRPAEALAMFEQNIADFAVRPNEGAHLQASINRVRALLAMGQAAQARVALAQASQSSAKARPAVRAHFRRNLLAARIAVSKALGDWQNASQMQDQMLHDQDSLLGISLQVKVSTLEDMLLDKTAHFKTELGLTQLHAHEARARARIQGLLILSAALLVILLLLVVLLNGRRRAERLRAHHEQESYSRELAELSLENERLENVQLNLQLEMKQRDITDYALVYSQRRKIFEDLLETLRLIKRSPNLEKNLQELIVTLNGKVDSEGKLNLATQHIEEVNHAYFARLTQRFPHLGPGELELCGMIRLGYSAKDIASLRNIAPSSVRIAKTRLKKKMALGTDIDLQKFLNEF
jgi:tetratricopeptide (TPR) repeat protein/DNA-binding CsgD family transcriptional regulator